MPITIDRGSLASKLARNAIESRFGGSRIIDTSTQFVEDDRNLVERSQDFISSIIGNRATNLIFKVAGWVVRDVLSFANFSFTSAWGWITANSIQLWTFDWNATDAELK